MRHLYVIRVVSMFGLSHGYAMHLLFSINKKNNVEIKEWILLTKKMITLDMKKERKKERKKENQTKTKQKKKIKKKSVVIMKM